jgi:hypothetical protein
MLSCKLQLAINGNCSATQKKSKTDPQDYLEEEGILIKYKYKMYK